MARVLNQDVVQPCGAPAARDGPVGDRAQSAGCDEPRGRVE